MYEALISHLRECAKYDKAENTFEEAADAIEELYREYESVSKDLVESVELCRKLKKPKWIPVTERLPDTPGEYMVAYHPCYWDRVSDGIEVGLDSFRGKTSWAKKKYQRVTHWMPLPQPPKEE